jgi:hypothetical protein
MEQFAELAADQMSLVWVIGCTRCKDERTLEYPDDINKAITQLVIDGWTAEQVENRNKHLLAPVMDTRSWPDKVTKVYCPLCSKGRAETCD